PQYHAGGWNIQPLLAWWTGATVVLERTFDAGRALRLIGERGVTTMMAVPTQYLMMAEHRDFAATDFSRVRGAVVGGAPMPAPPASPTPTWTSPSPSPPPASTSRAPAPESCWSAGRARSRATSATRRPPPRCGGTAGWPPGTSPPATRTATCGSSTG